jgi:hypothetical protein
MVWLGTEFRLIGAKERREASTARELNNMDQIHTPHMR